MIVACVQDMTEYLSSYEDSGTINERMAEEKKLAVVVKVSAAVKRCRTDPSSFVEELFRLRQFLQTPPIVRLEFPATVLRLEHEGLVMQANEKNSGPCSRRKHSLQPLLRIMRSRQPFL